MWRPSSLPPSTPQLLMLTGSRGDDFCQAITPVRLGVWPGFSLRGTSAGVFELKRRGGALSPPVPRPAPSLAPVGLALAGVLFARNECWGSRIYSPGRRNRCPPDAVLKPRPSRLSGLAGVLFSRNECAVSGLILQDGESSSSLFTAIAVPTPRSDPGPTGRGALLQRR